MLLVTLQFAAPTQACVSVLHASPLSPPIFPTFPTNFPHHISK